MKTALVTGASSGIGASAARHLAARGYRVILVARDKTRLEQVAADIGANATAECYDAADGREVLGLAARVCEAWGTPDVIVNSAGAGQWKRIEATSPDEALAMMQAPYLAAFNVTHAFMAGMLQRGSGVVIHVNSPACIFPWPTSVGYTAARWALRGLHEALCQDLVGTGVQSCQVIFGRVDSPYFEHNPGVTKVLPKIAGLVRTLSTDECGRVIAGIAARPRRESTHPFMLKLIRWTHHVCPTLVRWSLRIPGTSQR